MAYTGLATKVYKDPLTVQWMNSIKDNFDELFANMTIKAWIKFSASSTGPVVSGTGNVASIARNAAGDYTITFTTGFTTTGYAILGACGDPSGAVGDRYFFSISNETPQDTGTCRIVTASHDNTLRDVFTVCAAFIGTRK